MASLSTNSSSLRAWLLAAAASLALLGCGGGGDGGTDTGTGGGGSGGGGTTVQILDSFGQVVAAGGGDGVGVGDSGADGTAGEGAPIVGGTVTVTDVNGKSVSAVTDAQGYYRVKITGFTAPFVAKVTKPNGTSLRSINIKAPVTNAFITLNLSGLTDKIASDVAKAGGKSGAADLTPAIVAANTGAIATSISNLANQIAPVLAAAGIDSKSFDPLATPYRPNHAGYDFVLDNVKVTVDASGATVVTVSPTFVPPAPAGLTGTWGLSVTVSAGGQSQTGSGPDIPGAGVPKDAAGASVFCGTAYSQTFNSGGTSGTVTCNGNTLTVVSSSGTLSATYNFASYQGCGACGVGSQVVVTYNVTQTFTASGGSSNDTYTVVSTYTRKS